VKAAAPAPAAVKAAVKAAAPAPASSKKPAQGGNVKEVRPCEVIKPEEGVNFKNAVLPSLPLDSNLMQLASMAQDGAKILAQKKHAENLRLEKERKEKEDAEHKKLVEKHAAAVKEASIACQKMKLTLSNSPFTSDELNSWKETSESLDQDVSKESKTAAQKLIDAHAALVLKLKREEEKLAELTANKPLSPQEQVSRQKEAAAAQQKAAAKATEEDTAARTDDFNKKFDNFKASQKGTPSYVFRKAANSAMSPEGASVQKLCSRGMDPSVLLCISASLGYEFVPLFRMNAGTIGLVPKWKSLFPKYDSSKASKGDETLSEEEYYKRCVMIAVFNFWKHAKTILTRKNESRSEALALTMFQILSNAANFSNIYEFKTRQDFVAQQKELYREQKEKEKQEAAAASSAKSKSSGSSNIFSALTDDASCDSKEFPCARGGGAAAEDVCSVDSDAKKSSTGSSRGSVKTRGTNCPIRPSGEDRAKKDTTMAPIDEQEESLRRNLTVIAAKFGGLSTSRESFNNDSAAWAGHRSDIMGVLSQCGVNTTNSDSVFQFLKDHEFVQTTESEIKGANGRKKTVLRILDKDKNVVQKVADAAAAAGGSAADSTGGAATDAAPDAATDV
jgi:hypothetical protein